MTPVSLVKEDQYSCMPFQSAICSLPPCACVFAGPAGSAAAKPKSGLQAVLANLGELSEQKEYDSEFDMASFVGKLAPSS